MNGDSLRSEKTGVFTEGRFMSGSRSFAVTCAVLVASCSNESRIAPVDDVTVLQEDAITMTLVDRAVLDEWTIEDGAAEARFQLPLVKVSPFDRAGFRWDAEEGAGVTRVEVEIAGVWTPIVENAPQKVAETG